MPVMPLIPIPAPLSSSSFGKMRRSLPLLAHRELIIWSRKNAREVNHELRDALPGATSLCCTLSATLLACLARPSFTELLARKPRSEVSGSRVSAALVLRFLQKVLGHTSDKSHLQNRS